VGLGHQLLAGTRTSKASRGFRVKVSELLCKSPEDGMTGDRETVFDSFWNQERSLCELPSRVIPTQGYRKQGEWTRETVLQHAACTIGHKFQERDEGNLPRRNNWSMIVIVIVIVVFLEG
jgi:hypothetical protein